jgi:flagellin
MSMTLNAQSIGINNSNNLFRQRQALDKSFTTLSSGRRVNKAADDIAAMSISSGLTGKTRSLQQAKRNSEQALDFMQASEGYLQTIHNNIIRMKELAMQAASDTVDDKNRQFISIEFEKIRRANEHTIRSARFGSVHLLDGTAGDFEFQIGANNKSVDRLKITMDVYAVDPQKIQPKLSITTKESAQNAIQEMQDSISYISEIRANLGAAQNRLHSTINNLDSEIQNKKEANSRMIDADYAKETAEQVKNNVLVNTTAAMATHTNTTVEQEGKLIS